MPRGAIARRAEGDDIAKPDDIPARCSSSGCRQEDRSMQWHQGDADQIRRGEFNIKIKEELCYECLVVVVVAAAAAAASDHHLLSEASAFAPRQGEGQEEDQSQRPLHLLLQVQH